MTEKKMKDPADSSSSSRCFSSMCQRPISFSTELPVSSQKNGDESAGLSWLSTKSEKSTYTPLNFDEKHRGLQLNESESRALSITSVKSDSSMYQPMNFERTHSLQVSLEPCKMTARGGRSMYEPLYFESSQLSGSGSAALSKLSLNTNRSKFEPLGFETGTPRPVTGKTSTCPVQHICEHWSCLSSELDQSESPADHPCPQCGRKSREIAKQEKDTERDPSGDC